MRVRVLQSQLPDALSLRCTGSEPGAGQVTGRGTAGWGRGCTEGKVAFLSPSWSISIWGWEVAWGRRNFSPQLSLSLPRTAPALLLLFQMSLQALSHKPGSPWQLPPALGGPGGCWKHESENRQMQEACCGVFPLLPPAFSLFSAPCLPPALLTGLLPDQRLSACLSVCPHHPLQTPGLCPQHPRALLAQLSSNV